MTTSIQTLRDMYITSCKRHNVLANSSILYNFSKAEVTKSRLECSTMDILLDHLQDIHVLPLLDICSEIDASEIDAIDVRNGPSLNVLNGEYPLLFMRSLKQKLRVVDLKNLDLEEDFISDLSHKGLTCQVLNMRYSYFQKLKIGGDFIQLHTLILDSSLVTGFHEDCFTCMPNLVRLSMCETIVTNLWTTLAALLKLPSLIELRFQSWLCCNVSGNSLSLVGWSSDNQTYSSSENYVPSFASSSTGVLEPMHHGSALEELSNSSFTGNNIDIDQEAESTIVDSSDEIDMEFQYHQVYSYEDMLSTTSSMWDEHLYMDKQVSVSTAWSETEEQSSGGPTTQISDVALVRMSNHASPICFEKHYRDYMIASLPNLKVLDNMYIRKVDRERATIVHSEYFECLPYRRKCRENVVSLLHKREIKASHSFVGSPNPMCAYPNGNTRHSYTRSLCAAMMGASVLLHPLSIKGCDFRLQSKSYSPRQFEYHPTDPRLMAFGTLDGEVVVINHENGNIISDISSPGTMNSVLGLCWLKKYPSKLIAGSDNGTIKLYDIQLGYSSSRGAYSGAASATYQDFDQLTSVHVNSTDELFLASGYSKDVALYDVNSGRCLEVLSNVHREHINVVKFSNHSPSIFATSSFDNDVKMWDLRQRPLRPCYTTSSSRGNVMVCFSPDDKFLLVSAVDNEVRQLLAVDGRLHMDFEIPSTGGSTNYTRSYYMNQGDYILSGSCDEHVLRICCAQTGRRLRDISLVSSGSRNSMYVQSLRGDPFRDFNMSILAAYVRRSLKYDIVKINMLASENHDKEYSDHMRSHPLNSGGG